MSDTRHTEMLHTPGPWEVDGLYVRANGEYICDIKLADDDPNVIANARLIAAAPELLAALKCAHSALMDRDVEDRRPPADIEATEALITRLSHRSDDEKTL
jgi:hypothetical protein